MMELALIYVFMSLGAFIGFTAAILLVCNRLSRVDELEEQLMKYNKLDAAGEPISIYRKPSSTPYSENNPYSHWGKKNK